jgi:short-subunit dehydrogenase
MIYKTKVRKLEDRVIGKTKIIFVIRFYFLNSKKPIYCLINSKILFMQLLKDKQVLIVGATGSIGSRTAQLLAGSGAKLFLTGRNTEKLQAVAASCKVSPECCFALDDAQPGSINKLKESYFQQFPAIDILINAAGIGIIKPMDTLDETDFLNTLNANLVTPFLLMKAFLPAMKATKTGLIINIPGVLGKVPMAGAAAYCASKYGLVGMMQSIREEVKRTDIRITNLFLGGVDSAFWDTIDLKVQREKMLQADEAAKAIWFLCQQPGSGVVSEMVLQPFNHQAI